jgi:hypothetical protein
MGVGVRSPEAMDGEQRGVRRRGGWKSIINRNMSQPHPVCYRPQDIAPNSCRER